MMKQQLLKKLIQTLESKANVLPLVKSKKDIVPPEGNPEAELMFIGEAAGFHEHRLRRPFVGVAGKLLTKSLENNGWKKEEVWITNVVKARPPENRDPTPEEIKAYKTFLDQEIHIIQPKIIITLGRFSMGKFIPNAFISGIHGNPRWVNWDDMRLLVFPMYHPAAALRSGQVMQSFQQDFIKLRKTYGIVMNNNANEQQEKTSEEENSEE